MTYIETVLWRSLRKIYGKMTGFQKSAVIVEETDPLKASDAIYVQTHSGWAFSRLFSARTGGMEAELLSR